MATLRFRNRWCRATKLLKSRYALFYPWFWGILLICIPLGVATKFYSGPGALWVNDFSGGIVYELFWCGLAAVIWPRKRVFVPVVWVFLITSLLEVLQLWDLQCLRTIRSWFIGRALIGNTFSWLDFPHYLAGCWLAFFIIRLAKKTPLPPPDTALEEIVA